MEVGGIEPPSEEGVKSPSTRIADLYFLADNPAERQATGYRPAQNLSFTSGTKGKTESPFASPCSGAGDKAPGKTSWS